MAKLMSAYGSFGPLEARSNMIPWSHSNRGWNQAISENNLLGNSPIVAGVDYKVSELIKMLFVPSSSSGRDYARQRRH